MSKFTVFQYNMLNTGQGLAAEIASSSPERRAFVVAGSYIQTQSKTLRPSKFLNSEQKDLRFWMRKYEVNIVDIDKDVTYDDLYHVIYVKDIQSSEELENELEKYIQEVSLMKPSWEVENPLP